MSSHPNAAGLAGCIILVVDDDQDNRELLELILTWEGFRIRTAASGEAALASMESERPDLVLLDIMMPGMNGYEVVAKMRGDAAKKDIPVILVSALADRNARALGLKAGADDFLSKPVERAALVARVQHFLQPSRAAAG